MIYDNLTSRIREMLRDLGFNEVKVWHCSPMYWRWVGCDKVGWTCGGVGLTIRNTLDICEGSDRNLKTIKEVSL